MGRIEQRGIGPGIGVDSRGRRLICSVGRSIGQRGRGRRGGEREVGGGWRRGIGEVGGGLGCNEGVFDCGCRQERRHSLCTQDAESARSHEESLCRSSDVNCDPRRSRVTDRLGASRGSHGRHSSPNCARVHGE